MNLNAPKPFTPRANQIGKDWQLWKKEFMIFLKLSGGYQKFTEENRTYLLLNLMGSEGIKAKEKMNFDDPNDENDMDILIMKFDEIFDPPLNEAEERFHFFSRRKRENETIENFVAALKEKAETCNFGKQTDKFIIDMIIYNADNYLREIIFALNDVTIPELIQYHNQYSANNDKIKELTKNLSKVESSSDAKPQTRNPCWRCNTRHEQRNCPAYGTMCKVCNGKNHFSGLCKKESINTQKTDISQKKRVCSKCGTNHPYQQCPAYNFMCSKCRIKGHYDNRCKNAPVNSTRNEEQIKSTMECKNKSTIQQSDPKDLQHCLWCDSKHNVGKCQHNPNCTICDKFPHNICFNCKRNPHEISCYYKAIMTLPALPAKTLNFNSSNQNTSSLAENKNQEKFPNRSSAFSSYCNLCLKIGDHSSDNCPTAIINYRQKSFLQHTTANPLLKDVKVNQNSPRPAQYQTSTSHPTQTKPNHYKNNTQYQNNHLDKNNKKSDNCRIA